VAQAGNPHLTQAHVLWIGLLAASTASAQWLHYPSAGVPRAPDGSPLFTAPAPRVNGKPDFSGMWRTEENRPCAPDACLDLPIGQEFLNIAWGQKTPLPFQPWAANLLSERKANFGKDSPHARCLPPGVVRLHTEPLLRKIIQIPGLLVILNEHNASYRQIFTDGRPLPADPQPSFNGYSSGAWEGDTLVVRTNGLKNDLWLDSGGTPLTDAARLTERFTRLNYGTMEIEITVDDPKAYTKPWTTKLRHSLVVDTELMDYICLENEKSVSHLRAK